MDRERLQQRSMTLPVALRIGNQTDEGSEFGSWEKLTGDWSGERGGSRQSRGEHSAYYSAVRYRVAPGVAPSSPVHSVQVQPQQCDMLYRAANC